MKPALLLLAVSLTAVILPPPARAQDKATLDLLLKKGIITQQDYDDVMKGSQALSKGPTDPEPLKDTTPATSTETGPGRHPVGSYKDLERVPGGIEHLRKNGYRNVFTTVDSLLKRSERLSVGIVALRVAYQAENVDRKPSSSSLDTAERQNTTRDENGFRIRTAELYITGRLTPWSTYYMEVDFARQTEIALNSIYLDFYTKDMPYLKSIHPYISKLRVGQFREPFGIEQGTSIGLIDFVNRAYYTDLRVGANGTVDARPGDPGLNPFGKDNSSGFLQQLDIGVELTSKFPQLPLKPEFQIALINGAGRNFNDNNADKDVTGRLILSPLEGLKVYLAGYTGTSFYTAPNPASAIIPLNKDIRKTRQGVMYTYIPSFFPELKLQGEYIEGHDNGFRRRTWYQYILLRPFSFLPNFEPAYRYEEFTIDTNRPNSTLNRHTIGFNYYFHTNVKFTVNYEMRHDENEGNPFVTSGGGVANANNKNFFMTQIQFRY
jgi:hypothetical protein